MKYENKQCGTWDNALEYLDGLGFAFRFSVPIFDSDTILTLFQDLTDPAALAVVDQEGNVDFFNPRDAAIIIGAGFMMIATESGRMVDPRSPAGPL